MPEYPSANALTRELAELKRRVRDLESSQRAGNTALIEGALRILAADGSEVARFGLLADGTVGVDVKAGKITGAEILGALIRSGLATIQNGEISGALIKGSRIESGAATMENGTIAGAIVSGGQVNGAVVKTQDLIVTDSTGKEIPLAQSLFGIVTASDGTISVPESLTVPSWTAGGTQTSAFTTTQTGRVLIIASVNAVMVGVGDNVYAGVRIRNSSDTATVREANLTPGDLNAIIPNFGQYFAVSIQGILTLSPNTTYRARLMYGAKADPANNPDCTVRGSSLLVWPL